MMFMTINFSDFCDQFKLMGRDDHFTYEGKRALFNFLEESGDYELDVIELCCEYVELEDGIDQLRQEYSDTADMNDREAMQWLQDQTIVVSESPLVFVQF